MDILGIDVAKRTLAITLLTDTDTRHHLTCDNTHDGFAALDRWLQALGVTHVHACMEATNVYWEALAAWLHAHGHTVSVVNPARIAGYAKALMQRIKTDRQDSLIIALFCREHQPTSWEPTTPAQAKLRALVRLRHDLIQNRVQFQNRAGDATDADVKVVLESLVQTLERETAAVEARIQEHLAAQEVVQTQVALLDSVTGIGVVTATLLYAELGDTRRYASAKATAAGVGVTPSQYESGTSVRRRSRMSKMGNADVRAALYLPALTAMRWCPAIRAFAERLAARGKPKKVIIGAVMRKLIHICYGVLKHQTPYDPSKVAPKTRPST
jgi:transposase